MVNYWRHQFIIDTIIIFVVSTLFSSGIFPQTFTVPSGTEIVRACRAWVAPILTILGLVCATTAFLFTAIERSEFDLLRHLDVEDQLWTIFSEVIFWLAVAAISSASISFAREGELPGWVQGYSTFLFIMVSFCLLKFAWLIRHIIAVRRRKSCEPTSTVP